MRSQYQRVRGQALIPALFVTLILTAVAVSMAVIAKREVRAGVHYSRDTQMYLAARGAVFLAASQLAESTSGGASPPSLTLPPETDSNGWTQLGECWYKVEVIDTASRVNLNLATADSLNRLPGFNSDPNLVAAVVDWRDTDQNPATSPNGGQGIESDYYESLQPPYICKNGPFDTVEELLLVRGMTPEILYGAGNLSASTAASNTDTLPQSRQAGGGQTGQTNVPAVGSITSSTPLAELVTTYSKERNVASDGTARINLKTCTAQQLRDLGLSQQAANSLTQNRGQDGANLRSIADVMGSPYQGFTRQFMQQNADKLTLTDEADRPGLININTASREVLATIPGVDETLYNTVVNARESGTSFTGLNDLFQLTQLNRQQLQALVDNVCTKSSIYVVRVRVRLAGSAQVYAVQALVEITPGQQQEQGAASGQTTTPTTETAGQFRIWQWKEVGRAPGWQSWSPAPNYISTTTSGGSVVNP